MVFFRVTRPDCAFLEITPPSPKIAIRPLNWSIKRNTEPLDTLKILIPAPKHPHIHTRTQTHTTVYVHHKHIHIWRNELVRKAVSQSVGGSGGRGEPAPSPAIYGPIKTAATLILSPLPVWTKQWMDFAHYPTTKRCHLCALTKSPQPTSLTHPHTPSIVA